MTENILDSMGVMPFPDTDEDDAPPKLPTSIRLSPATKRQIAWLEQAGHGKQSEIIALAVYGMWRVEQTDLRSRRRK